LGFELGRWADYKQRVSEPLVHVPSIDASTRYCAVLGFPVRHSASPAMQNAGILELGLNWRYLALEVRSEELRVALAGARAMQFIGLNLTVPHKTLAMDMMDALDESAKTWRAVNTVRIEGRDRLRNWLPVSEFTDEPPDKIRLQGFNTDADALAKSLQEDLGIQLRGARVVLLGIGGVGGVAALKLASEQVGELFLVNRTVSKAASVAAEIRRRHPEIKVQLGYPRGEVDLAINATSLGLSPNDPLPVDAKLFSLRQARNVYDTIYRPAETPLLQAARAGGSRTANGLGMLLHQGARALEIWSGKRAPIDVMRRALEKNIYG
jgi:shikimate dehydrogenase